MLAIHKNLVLASQYSSFSINSQNSPLSPGGYLTLFGNVVDFRDAGGKTLPYYVMERRDSAMQTRALSHPSVSSVKARDIPLVDDSCPALPVEYTFSGNCFLRSNEMGVNRPVAALLLGAVIVEAVGLGSQLHFVSLALGVFLHTRIK